MSDMEVKITSHVRDIKTELGNKLPVVMEALGLQAQGNAIDEITAMDAVDTGRLRNSITWATTGKQGLANTQGGMPALPEDYAVHGSAQDNEVCIGTNVEYAPYIEYGTYKMASRPFLRNAIANYTEDYKDILKKALKS